MPLIRLDEVSALIRLHCIGVKSRSRGDSGLVYLALALFFLAGSGGGYLACGLVSDPQRSEISEYVQAYARVHAALRPLPVAGIVIACFRQPVLLALSAAISCGWLVPCLMMGQGFLLAFSVRSFVLSLGRKGLLCAFAAFGVRCLFVLPCCFYLAARVWPRGERRRYTDYLKRGAGEAYGGVRPYFICAAVLLLGCAVEITLVPRLFSYILRRIF
jgi:hypothetical protein